MPGTAAAFRVAGNELLLINGPDGAVALASLCANVTRFLLEGDFSGCVVDSVPTCNRHLGEKTPHAPFGLCDEPIYVYASKNDRGTVYVDLDQRRLSAYEHISCSPVIESGALVALQFNLWVDGTQVHRVLAHPPRARR